jgi:hypothetical protein
VTTKAAAAGASNGLRSIRVARPARSLPQADGMWAWVVGVGGRGPGGSGLGWDPLLGRRARQITSKSKRLDQTGCPGGLLQKRRGPAAAPRFRQFEQPVPSAAAASGQAGLHRHRLGPPPCRDRERHQKYSSTMIPCSRRPGESLHDTSRSIAIAHTITNTYRYTCAKYEVHTAYGEIALDLAESSPVAGKLWDGGRMYTRPNVRPGQGGPWISNSISASCFIQRLQLESIE